MPSPAAAALAGLGLVVLFFEARSSLAAFEGWIYVSLIFGLVPAIIAALRGRSLIVWWLFGTLAPPLALIMVLVRPGRARPGAYAPASSSVHPARAVFAARHPCPQCAELILPAARVCPFCRSPLTQAAAAAAPVSATRP